MRKIFFFLLISVIPAAVFGEVYLTKDEALRLTLGTDCEIQYDPKPLTDALTGELQDRSLIVWAREEKEAHFFVCKKEKRITGYALIDEEVGKHLPITFIVGISPEGSITRVEIMVFREEKGWEVKDRNFLAQFEGTNEKSNFEIEKGIRNVTGATYSSKSLARGSERALYLWKKFYKG